jgi:hypothetical protein
MFHDPRRSPIKVATNKASRILFLPLKKKQLCVDWVLSFSRALPSSHINETRSRRKLPGSHQRIPWFHSSRHTTGPAKSHLRLEDDERTLADNNGVWHWTSLRDHARVRQARGALHRSRYGDEKDFVRRESKPSVYSIKPSPQLTCLDMHFHAMK